MLFHEPGGTMKKPITTYMQPSISPTRKQETPEAKARWFQSLSREERQELLCSFTDIILDNNPQIVKEKDAQPVTGRILVLSEA
jgi:hypothetical protein